MNINWRFLNKLSPLLFTSWLLLTTPGSALAIIISNEGGKAVLFSENQKYKDRYIPAQEGAWKGRIDGPTPQRVHEVIQCLDLSTQPLPDKKGQSTKTFALIGFACHEGVVRNQGRIGAAQGPSAFRSAFAQVPLHRMNRIQIYDCGDIICEDGDLELSQACLGEAIAYLFEKGFSPIVIGGGHEVAWGHFQGIRKAFPTSQISVVNFDAHFDIRPLIEKQGIQLGTSGTSFTQMYLDSMQRNLPFDYACLGIQKVGNTESLFQKAKEIDVSFVSSRDFFINPPQVKSFLQAIIERSEAIYCTICLDVFAAPYAPGVSAPQPLGILPWHAIEALEKLTLSGKVIALDLAELCPQYDRDNTTAKLAAHLVGTYIDLQVSR